LFTLAPKVSYTQTNTVAWIDWRWFRDCLGE